MKYCGSRRALRYFIVFMDSDSSNRTKNLNAPRKEGRTGEGHFTKEDFAHVYLQLAHLTNRLNNLHQEDVLLCSKPGQADSLEDAFAAFGGGDLRAHEAAGVTKPSPAKHTTTILSQPETIPLDSDSMSLLGHAATLGLFSSE